ncbi:hypothetical protein F5X71_00270 [Nocardia brasiliensis]|uniref:Uncharacterized protein n=1 Tax=Nocardia brasiliensis TaxID=37326 RepID=A0A6G9XJ80_NOCBR|nr:hypothetical protein [Nocardia brasiliensis]QIS00969.1 hypothetical protein F5X71_00270 [Nocardia brasiliensis]
MTGNTSLERIPCSYADGSPVPEIEADMIMRAFGFSSAREAERIISSGTRRRRERQEQAATPRFEPDLQWDQAHVILSELGKLTGHPTADARRITRYLATRR